jgi:hypothetical protein
MVEDRFSRTQQSDRHDPFAAVDAYINFGDIAGFGGRRAVSPEAERRLNGGESVPFYYHPEMDEPGGVRANCWRSCRYAHVRPYYSEVPSYGRTPPFLPPRRSPAIFTDEVGAQPLPRVTHTPEHQPRGPRQPEYHPQTHQPAHPERHPNGRQPETAHRHPEHRQPEHRQPEQPRPTEQPQPEQIAPQQQPPQEQQQPPEQQQQHEQPPAANNADSPPIDRSKFYISQNEDRNLNKDKILFACGPTSLCMALADFDIAPATEEMRRKLMNTAVPGTGGKTTMGQQEFPGGPHEMALFAEQQGLHARDRSGITDVNAVNAALDEGKGVIINGGVRLQKGGIVGHFVYIAGRDEKGLYIVGDPTYPDKHRWSRQELQDFMNISPVKGFTEVWRGEPHPRHLA